MGKGVDTRDVQEELCPLNALPHGLLYVQDSRGTCEQNGNAGSTDACTAWRRTAVRSVVQVNLIGAFRLGIIWELVSFGSDACRVTVVTPPQTRSVCIAASRSCS